MDSHSESDQFPVPASGCRFNPWLFFSVLLIPGVISIAVLFTGSGNDYGESALITLIVTSSIAGLICGIHFAMAQRSQSPGMKIVIGIVSIVGCGGAAFALGMGGCYLIAIFFGNF